MLKKILIVEDDKEIAENLRELFSRKDIQAYSVLDGQNLERLLKFHKFDLVILDLMLPYKNGVQLCQEIKALADVPIIMISALKDPHEKINALELGADDFLDKPVAVEEVIARAERIINRKVSYKAETQSQIKQYKFGNWQLDVNQMKLTSDNAITVALSKQLFDILILFVTQPQALLTRNYIASMLYGEEHEHYDRSIDVAISKLRKRLQSAGGDDDYIQTRHGKGYCFNLAVVTE